jgi:tetratricopeptide (TPR) repeat protein
MDTKQTPQADGQQQPTVEELYSQAMVHFNAGRYTEAGKFCNAIVQDVPNHIDSINLIGVVAQKLNRHDLAASFFQRAIKIDDNRGFLCCNLGLSLYLLGRIEEAVVILQTGFEKEPGNSQITDSLNSILLNQELNVGGDDEKTGGKKEGAKELHSPTVGNGGIISAEIEDKDSLQYALAMSKQHQDAGSYLEEEKWHKKIIAALPSHANSLHRLSQLLFIREAFDDGLRVWKQLAFHHPSFLRVGSDPDTDFAHIQKMSERPIIIGGCGRSGTTLLLSFLSCHANIKAIPVETYALCPSAYSNIAKPDKQPKINPGLIYHRLLADGFDPSCTRWCEKTPKNILFVEQILNHFGPDARFINCVRDGRDVITSVHPRDPTRFWTSATRWIDDVAAGRLHEENPQVMVVRYEDLILQPEDVSRKLCRFLGEPFDDAFLSYPESAKIKTTRAWSHTAKQLHAGSMKRWQDEKYKSLIEDFMQQEQALELLEHYGYEI